MAYDKIYTRVNWENEPSVATPINETNLNNMDATIDELDNRVVELSKTTPCIQEVDELPEQGVLGVLYQLNTEYAKNFELDGLPDDLKTQANYNTYITNGGKATIFHTTDDDNPFILIYDCYVGVYFTYKADGTTSDFYVRIMGAGLGTNPRLYTYNTTNKAWTYQAITSNAGDYILKVDGVFRQTVKQVEFPNITVSNSIGSVLPDCGLEWVSGDENNQQWFYYFYDKTSDVPINDMKTYANNLWEVWSGYPYTIATTLYFWNGNGYTHVANSSELAEYQKLLIQGDGINIDVNNVISTESPKQIFRNWADNGDTTSYTRYNTDADFKAEYGISVNDIINVISTGKYHNLTLNVISDLGGMVDVTSYSRCTVLYIDYAKGGDDLFTNYRIYFMADYTHNYGEQSDYYVMMPHVLNVSVQYTDESQATIDYITAEVKRTHYLNKNDVGSGIKVEDGLVKVKAKPNGGITVNADGVSVSESITNSIDNSTMIGTVNGEIATIQDGGNDMPLKSCIVDIEPVQSGSGDPSPSNVRPITGWTECNLIRDGFNLFDENSLLEATNWSLDDGYYTGTMNDLYNKYGNGIWFNTSGYTGQFCMTFTGYMSGGSSGRFEFYYTDGTTSSVILTSQDTKQIGISTIGKVVEKIKVNYSSSGTVYVKDFCINISDANKNGTYAPYTGNTYNIEFPSEAGTVYGGTLDVTNGVLTVDRVIVDMGTLSYTYYQYGTLDGGYTDGLASVIKKPIGSSYVTKSICNELKEVQDLNFDNASDDVYSINAYGRIKIHYDGVSTGTELKTAMNGVQLVYELATPTTYQLTPTEIKTLLGINNIFADCGDVDVEYVRDATIVINNLLARIQELENA